MNSTFLTEQSFAQIIAANGGRVYRVGGCVRDQFMGLTPQDIDFCIVGMVKKNFKLLFPAAEEYGKSFPVFRLAIDGSVCELAFARTERKISSGYKGFKVSSNPKVTIEDDLFRRDTTVNSIAMDCLTGTIIDPFHGIQDIKDKILRATSHHFSDDPMRALRLASQSARLGFKVDPDTLPLASIAANELGAEPTERMLMELTKVLAQAQQPATFFQVLAQTGLLPITFKEIADLPREDFSAAMIRLDGVAKITEQPKLRFATLGLVLNKESLSHWNHRMTLPGDWLDSAITIGKTVALLRVLSPENVVTAIDNLRRGALCAEEFDMVAKGMGLNHLPPLTKLKGEMTRFLEEPVPEKLKGREIGEWLKHKQIQALSKLL